MERKRTIRPGKENKLSRTELEKLLSYKSELLVKQADNFNNALTALTLLAGLRWTKQRPNSEGWYWAERVYAGLPEVSMVFVTRIDATYTHVWNPLEKKEYGTNDFDWWYGPLPYPYRLRLYDRVREPDKG